MYQRIREALKMTKDEMAVQLGIDVTTLEQWEAGTATPDEYIRTIFKELDSRLRVYEKLKGAVETLKLAGNTDAYLDDIRQLLESKRPESASVPLDDVLIEHLSFAIDGFLREKELDPGFPKSELAEHIYHHIKFLF